MMGVLGSDQQLCPCYKKCQEFHKLVELKDTGLVVYCHSKRRENVRQGEVIEKAVKDVFILQNTRDVKITTADLTSEFEKKDISCPRCRKAFEHAQELIQKIPAIGMRNTIGVCDHCRRKAQYIKKPCFTCEETVKKFLSVRGEQKEDTKKYVKIWLSRMGHLLKDTLNLDKPKKLETRTYSDVQINQLVVKSPKYRREPEIEQMFCSETRRSFADLYAGKTSDSKEVNVPEKSALFTQPTELPETTSDFISPVGDGIKSTSIESFSMQSDLTFVGTQVPEPELQRTSRKERKQKDMSDHYDETSMEAKEAIKKKHDLSLRQMVRSEKYTGVTSKRPEVYEILKIAPWEHSKTDLKDYDGISDLFILLPKSKTDFSSKSSGDLQSVSHKLTKYESRSSQKESKPKRSEHVADSTVVKGTSKKKPLSSRTPQKIVRDTRSEQYRVDKYDHGKLEKEMFDSELIFQKIKRDEYQDKEFKSQRGTAKLTGEKAIESKDTVKNILKTQFSFFFPEKVQKHKKRNKLGARSSQQIRTSQEKIRQQAESEQKQVDEEQQRKLDLQLGRAEKTLNERQRQSVSDEKDYTVDMRLTTESKKSFDDLDSKSFTEEEKQHETIRTRTEEDEYKTDRVRRDMLSESVLKSKLSVDSGSVEKDWKDRTQLRDKMEKGKMLRHKEDDEIDVLFERSKSRPDREDKTGRELDKSKRELKSKSDTRETFADVPEKARKEHSSKTDRELETSRRDLKSKSDRRDTFDDVTDKARKELSSKTDRELEKSKRDLKSKSDRRDTFDDVTDKARKELTSKTDRESEKSKRDLKSKSDRRDTFDDVTDKARKELSSKTDRESEKYKRDLKSKSDRRDTFDDMVDKIKKGEKKDKYDDVSEKAKIGFKSKSGLKDKSEEESRKEKETKKDYKLKHDQKDTVGELSTPAVKRDQEKDGEITAKSRKGKHDDVTDLNKKYPRIKSESIDKYEATLKSKTGRQDFRSDVVPEHVKKDLKSKTEREKTVEGKKDFGEQYKDKSGKIKKPKSESKDWDKQMDKEMAVALKTKEKQERDEKLQRDKEEKERLKLVEQYGKEKEVPKKQSAKEAAEPPKKSSKDKETSKKLSPKKQKSPEIEIPMSKIKVKESKISTQPQDIKKKKGESPREVQEPSAKALGTKLGHETTAGKEPKQKKSKKEDTSKEPKDKDSKKEETSKVEGEPPKKKTKESADEAEFRKLQAKLKKDKEDALKQKKLEEVEAQKLKELAEKRAKEEGDQKIKSSEAKAVPKSVKTQSSEQSTAVQRIKINPCDIDPKIIKTHRTHHINGHKSSSCVLCQDSELEIDVISYDDKINPRKGEITDIIIGEYILKYKPRPEKIKEPDVVPLLFKSKFIEESIPQQPLEIVKVSPPVDEPEKKSILAALLGNKDVKGIDPEPGKGIIRYALSDRTFIDKGWTMLPTEKVVRKMNVYRMRPAHPEFDWFEHNKNKRLMTYDTGERLAEFDDNGRGRWYYRSGRLALDYYDAEETNAQQRFVIYSSGEPDERGRTHPITILATFDYLGNGIVFDHAGKIRLKYNQTEGVVLDRGIGPVSHWKWHTLNDPPVLQQVMIDTQMAHKDPEILKLGPAADSKVRPDNEEMLAIEFDNFIKEKSKKLSQKFKPFQIKMKALKINEHFSLKVLDQATIYLIFRDGTTNLKLNIGMILDHQEIVDTDTAEVGEVSNNLERFPARTDSLAGLQRSVAYAQRYERQRTERERRLRRPEPCASADHLTAAASPPLRPPLRTLPTGSLTTSAGYCSCRKPSNNLYYNTRLL